MMRFAGSIRLTGPAFLAAVAGVALALTVGCSGKRADPNAEYASLDFSLQDPHGAMVKMASFKGRPLIVNFWATYCIPCKTEIPLFNDLLEEHRRQHLEVVGISYDDAPSDIVKFTQGTPMHYPVLVGLGHADLMDAYQADIALPTSWVIRADGTVVAKHIGAETRDWFETQLKGAF